MGCWRCGTCHKLYIGLQVGLCKNAGHEQPYDDEA